MSEVCQPCAEFRRGERENAEALGVTVHACEQKRGGTWNWLACPCGCAQRRPGQLAEDRAIHGTAFVGPLGERIDPLTVTAVADPDAAA